MRSSAIYKICRSGEWSAAQAAGRFKGAPVDLADGFIHFSTGPQVRETAARHFSGETGLILLTVNPSALGDDLRWEPSRGGALFPHLYTPLPLDAILSAEPLELDAEGIHRFPPEIGS